MRTSYYKWDNKEHDKKKCDSILKQVTGKVSNTSAIPIELPINNIPVSDKSEIGNLQYVVSTNIGTRTR